MKLRVTLLMKFKKDLESKNRKSVKVKNWTQKQNNIYDGLKSIGPEIAEFFRIKYCPRN